jgi:hypothetical protein
MPHDVFVSFSSKDKDLAASVCATLEKGGIPCWIAPRDAEPGTSYARSIINAIAQSRVFVLIFTHNANDSPHVMTEVEKAFNHPQRIPIIPLRLEEVQPSEELEYYIHKTHWLDARSRPLDGPLQQLVEAVRRKLPKPEPTTGQESSQQSLAAKREEFRKLLDDERFLGDQVLEETAAPLELAASEPEPPEKSARLPLAQAPRGSNWQNSFNNLLICIPQSRLPASHPANQTLHASRTCVSNQEYREFVRCGYRTPAANRGHPNTAMWLGDDLPHVLLKHPVIYVRHDDALAFCDWLTERERRLGLLRTTDRYTLPTFEQWKAFAAGAKLSERTVLDRQWVEGQLQPTEPVDWKYDKASPLGLMGLYGNVFEWCLNEEPKKVRSKEGVGQQLCNLAVGGGWSSSRSWLQQKIADGSHGAIWCPRGWPMKDGGFRVCLLATTS